MSPLEEESSSRTCDVHQLSCSEELEKQNMALGMGFKQELDNICIDSWKYLLLYLLFLRLHSYVHFHTRA